jgi:hypothetical protein
MSQPVPHAFTPAEGLLCRHTTLGVTDVMMRMWYLKAHSLVTDTSKNTVVPCDRNHKSGQARGSGRTEEGLSIQVPGNREGSPEEVTRRQVTKDK